MVTVITHNKQLTLSMWNTLNSKDYQVIIQSNRRKSAAFVVVYDVTSKLFIPLKCSIYAGLEKESLAYLKENINAAKESAPEALLYVVCNKMDLVMPEDDEYANEHKQLMFF